MFSQQNFNLDLIELRDTLTTTTTTTTTLTTTTTHGLITMRTIQREYQETTLYKKLSFKFVDGPLLQFILYYNKEYSIVMI